MSSWVRSNRGGITWWLLIALAIVGTVWIAVRVNGLAVEVTEQQQSIDMLVNDGNAVQDQIRELGEVPVAPPPEERVDGANLPEPGRPGSQGIQGERGPQGEKGDRGELGPVGPIGLPGLPGGVGPAGSAGADSTVPGPAGESIIGPAGPQGEPGIDGIDGADGRGIVSIACGDDNNWVITYDAEPLTQVIEGPCRFPPGQEGN